ncbi:N-alpha-acetyltransferase 60 [Ischnura elegans]|uniref:N-alpha-acetyltransferase 60 n=1 Tax=Ischnura elegans TaxID=197161 RepID=UPI001ED8ADA0|nr:N-alpha-acetyltransferase 60 [Ischnura elegans]XP_046404266.1 N-alpha-acetyltransferase 60 [Ischnura elegans]
MAGLSWYAGELVKKPRSSCMTKPVPLCSLSNLQLRFLCPSDLEEVQALCRDWFPIDYPDSWYIDITSDPRFYSLAAVYQGVIIGLIVAEIKAYAKLNREDRGLLSPSSCSWTVRAKSFTESPSLSSQSSIGTNPEAGSSSSLLSHKEVHVGYILSLGVVEKHRRNGIASLLLDSLVSHLTADPSTPPTSSTSPPSPHSPPYHIPTVKALYLHVLATNSAAIRFYERRNFRLHSFLPLYYSIQGKCKDGFTYVLYINGGHPPWGLIDHVKHCCGVVYHGWAQPCRQPLLWLWTQLSRATFGWAWPPLRRLLRSTTASLASYYGS